ncbi:hypothetical protein C7974DRAFT_417321 [Boeremia exigua]|uniref:uncharacterized protein n=1 Tax=Boeremia exigua TaxID=749465 RepID=UPI001E8D943C|nr:uncharacterized protein C7974DRAFT_417321 [Boeremia exigua]KAH6615128.1 hypothetical protein C7974DRAFT_417321 [Boeremia exigua]
MAQRGAAVQRDRDRWCVKYDGASLSTSQQWSDFAKTAGCPPEGPDRSIHVPYILVYSASQEKLDRTEKISGTVETQLESATWEQIKSSFLALAGPNSKGIITVDLLILDQQSFEDRTVIVVEKGAGWVLDGKEVERVPYGQDNAQRLIVWKKYRVPFEHAFAVQCGIEGFCSTERAEEYFVEEIEREVAPED